ncbi:uncharacterized protein LOC143276125 [Babylonia areolata]|uniref:uncharacterized protein LOC143276125 n=1 Tax=Babylonia areolata TaxID=304850 RepID=UPI003FD60409
MGVFQTTFDTFMGVCSTFALSVTTVSEWTAYILHANYILVTSLYTWACYIVDIVVTTLHWIVQSVITVLLYVFDFLSEIYACVCALLVLLWRICILVYKLLCLLFTGVETLVLGLWNGGVLTYKALHQSALDVVETCESTRDYMAMMAQDFVVYVCDIFTTIGSFSAWLIRGLWIGIGYVPATLSIIPSYITQWVANLWMRLTMWVSFAFMGVTQETYIGIAICCMLYMVLSRLVHILHRRGFMFFSFRRQRQNSARQTNHVVAHMTFDRGFESDFEDDDVDNSSPEASDNENTDGGEESDAHSELTLSDGDSDDNSAESESDASLNSQTFTSEDSDHEIDVQLPTFSGDHLLHSRSSTPSRNVSKDMNPDDFERELERERDKRKCVVCQDANKSVLILPCKHMCLCVRCANQIVRSTLVGRRVCPLCRRRIERVMDVYV